MNIKEWGGARFDFHSIRHANHYWRQRITSAQTIKLIPQYFRAVRSGVH